MKLNTLQKYIKDIIRDAEAIRASEAKIHYHSLKYAPDWDATLIVKRRRNKKKLWEEKLGKTPMDSGPSTKPCQKPKKE